MFNVYFNVYFNVTLRHDLMSHYTLKFYFAKFILQANPGSKIFLLNISAVKIFFINFKMPKINFEKIGFDYIKPGNNGKNLTDRKLVFFLEQAQNMWRFYGVIYQNMDGSEMCLLKR